MADDPKEILTFGPETMERLHRALPYIEAMMRATIPGGKNTPGGPTFPPVQPPPPRFTPPSPDDKNAVLRICSAYGGRGWYSATITTPGTADADVTTALSSQAATFITSSGATVIAANLFEAVTGNDAGLVKPLAGNELCLGRFWRTQNNGTQVYVITGRFKMIDGSNYMVPLFNAGQWTPDWPRAH